ncbi:MAG TPA: phosphatase PAP2 family protein [Burkholderiaceae bacterium]|nr:phosphatase PAP2 family protein [Burkholderiaceae bacterium]
MALRLGLRSAVIGVVGILLLALCSPLREQNCGWSKIDHEVAFSESGVWNPTAYRGLMITLTLGQIGGALWLGADEPLGRTMWQGIDSQILTAVGAEAGKYIFTRARPTQGNNPCLWFQGSGHYSFPSGEAASAAALVTPYILQYAREQPLVYSLLLVPIYVGAGRIRNQAHWQTDVIAGWALGGLAGWYAHGRETPITVQVLPHSITVGWHHSF